MKREVRLTWVSLAVVCVSISIFYIGFLSNILGSIEGLGWPVLEGIAFVIIVTLLVTGNLVYHFSRLGYLRRRQAHEPATREELESIYKGTAPRLGILIPSYREERRVLLQTVISAALLEYPNRRITVLLDDPPNSRGRELSALEDMRASIAELHDEFARWERLFSREHLSYTTRFRTGPLDLPAENQCIAALYDKLAGWLDDLALSTRALTTTQSNHTDEFFIENILIRPAMEHRSRAATLRSTPADPVRLMHEYLRLRGFVSVEISSFERKRYVNLSHQPNKAMNLNSYIGLIGNTYREVEYNDGIHLEDCDAHLATLVVPPVEYLLTLDADSVVLADYALRLIKVMEQDRSIAVAQTPYSAFPRSPGILERIAGATTDIQYFIHQGFTWYNATFWVGANAMLRMRALYDIVQTVEERGFNLQVFIQERTVIEDTGSTIDLVRRGWRLYNYPERLAYSATPPDFGSLIIQRRRWSNGGLIILAEYMRHFWKSGGRVSRLGELGVRSHYLFSPAVGNFGLLILLLYPFDDRWSSIWLALAAAPYYFLYARDLRVSGYRRSDLFRVYVLNLMLIPVNLAGVVRSLQQAVTGKRAAFARTPKIDSRTLIAPLHVAFQWALLAYLAQAVVSDIIHAHYSHAIFVLANCIMYFYGITWFLGWREGYSDIRCAISEAFLQRRRSGRSPLGERHTQEAVAQSRRRA